MKRRSSMMIWVFLATCLLAGTAVVANAKDKPIEDGKKAEVKGVIVSRFGDLVKIQEEKSGKVDFVKLGEKTVIEREVAKHPFPRHKDMDVTALVPGLTIEAIGVGNAEGEVEAAKIKFNPDAFAVEVAEEQQIKANESATDQAQSTADQGVANATTAQASADQAQNAANQAQNTANQGLVTAITAGGAALAVNQRVSDLGEYTTVAEVGVYFPNDGSTLDAEGKAALDKLASSTAQANGYLIEVAGYTSSTGNAELNQKLSEERAASVVHYLIENDNIPMRRIVVPAGYGKTHPAAENTDKQGRALNRRVDVKVMVNQGLQEGN